MAKKSTEGTKQKEKEFEELQLLDLRKCKTVSDIVDGMSRCSFGARMLGEAAHTLTQMITSRDNSEKPLIIYDGKENTPFGKLLLEMVKKGWFTRILTPEQYSTEKASAEKNVIVIGNYSERHEEAIYKKPSRTIFINDAGRAKPGQTRDGYFPDVVFADPRFIMPVIYCALLERIDRRKTTAMQLMEELKKYGGQAEKAAAGAETFYTMSNDKGCFVFLTLSGAMTIAKMGLVICDMIDLGMINCIVSTGALIAHGLVESIGLKHYKHNPSYSDALLAGKKLNRVTDTLEPESNFDHVESILGEVLDSFDSSEAISPSVLTKRIGKHLSDKYPDERGILKSAYEKNVPVLIPAFVDSEIGNDVYTHNEKRKNEGKRSIVMNMENDTHILIKVATQSDRIGIFTIGGGVPRNYAQNVAPLIELLNARLKMGLSPSTFKYGTRIAPDPMYYGHLSGCTYSEGMSWRKMDTHGKFAEIQMDATQVWPFIVKYVMERNNLK